MAKDLPLLLLDEKRIQQVVDNLLNNALKFTPERGKVSVESFLNNGGSDGHGQVQVKISDSGEGIPREELNRIFDRFYQGASGNGKSHGTGLGLAIARYIVEGHQGMLWAESEAGKGSTFIFTLPSLKPEGELH
jgi:signal transduction histidine kinase